MGARSTAESRESKATYPVIGALLGASALFGLAVLPRLAPGEAGGGDWGGGAMNGKPAPAFTLPVAANGAPGSTVSTEGLKGHPVLLDFWASWCGPCAVEAPVIDRLSKRYAGRGLVVVGVNSSDPAAVVARYTAQKGLSYAMVVDEGGEVGAQYGVDRLPSLVLLDKNGNVTKYMTGTVDEATLGEMIDGVL